MVGEAVLLPQLLPLDEVTEPVGEMRAVCSWSETPVVPWLTTTERDSLDGDSDACMALRHPSEEPVCVAICVARVCLEKDKTGNEWDVSETCRFIIHKCCLPPTAKKDHTHPLASLSSWLPSPNRSPQPQGRQ